MKKSIYVKFVIFFLGIWWLLNGLTFGVIMRVMANSLFTEMEPTFKELFTEFHRIRITIGLSFLISACIGTIIFLIVARGIVKPIKRLSIASKEVAKGNFDVELIVKSDDEIGRLTGDFNTMVEELKSIDILRKDFVSNVSHEFRTPITSIKGFAKLIKEDIVSDEQRIEYSSIIIEESERLMELSSNLLCLTELDSQVIREKATCFWLDEQIRKSILLLEPQWSKKNIGFEIDLIQTKCFSEENLLFQVWLNLIQNAIKFSNDNDIIRISLMREENTLIIQITDNGVGIADEDKYRVFERFFKGDKSHSKEGNGLGLVIAKKIVEISGGNISFESILGEGTKFIVKLPYNIPINDK